MDDCTTDCQLLLVQCQGTSRGRVDYAHVVTPRQGNLRLSGRLAALRCVGEQVSASLSTNCREPKHDVCKLSFSNFLPLT